MLVQQFNIAASSQITLCEQNTGEKKLQLNIEFNSTLKVNADEWAMKSYAMQKQTNEWIYKWMMSHF